MRSTHLTTGWLWVLSGGFALSFSAPAIAQENKPQDKPAVKESQPAKDPLFPFTISKETTRFTEPLKPDGTVDYAAALNARNSQGLNPQDNAGVLLMQAFGREAVPEANRERFYKALGIAVPAGNQSTVQDLGQIVKQHLEEKGVASDDNAAYQPFWDQQGQASSQPWRRKEFPLIAQWVDANADALKLAVEASQKSRLFIPLVAGEKESLIAANLQGVQEMRSVARLLSARAMLALEEGRIEEAQADLLACHRLGSLLGHRSMLIQALVSYALDATACQADLAMAQSKKVTPAQLAAYRQKLADLPALPKLSETIDQGERFFGLDAIANLATNLDEESAQVFGLPKVWRRMLGVSMDWDLIMKQFNEQYDRMAAAVALPTFAERMAELGKMDEELLKLQKEANQPAQFALMFLGANPPRAMVSRQMGNVLLGLLMPAVTQAATAETRLGLRREMTIVALALAEYEREHGTYPETLDALTPKYLKSIPKDRFTDQPLKYQRQDQGYLLYSVGANGKDDKGQDRNANNDADDWSIRVPTTPEL